MTRVGGRKIRKVIAEAPNTPPHPRPEEASDLPLPDETNTQHHRLAADVHRPLVGAGAHLPLVGQNTRLRLAEAESLLLLGERDRVCLQRKIGVQCHQLKTEMQRDVLTDQGQIMPSAILLVIHISLIKFSSSCSLLNMPYFKIFCF